MPEFCCFIVLLYQYIHSFIFPEMAERGGATAPIATPLNPPLEKEESIEGSYWKYVEQMELTVIKAMDS